MTKLKPGVEDLEEIRSCKFLWTDSETLEFWNLGILVLCNLKPCSFRTKLRTLEPARNLWKAQGQKLNMWSQNKGSLKKKTPSLHTNMLTRHANTMATGYETIMVWKC